MQDVLIAVLLGLVFAVPPSIAAWFAWRVLQAVRTPSGDPIGHVAERTEHLASTNSAHLIQQGRLLTDAQVNELHGRVTECLKLLEALRSRKDRH